MVGIIVCTTECNLGCRYCYEYAGRHIQRKSRAAINSIFEQEQRCILEYVRSVSYVAKKSSRSARIILHGGEPTLINVSGIAKVLEKISELDNITIQIQTNGTIVQPMLAKVLKEYSVDIVVSLDGPRELHDAYRVKSSGEGTFDQVMRSVNLLKSVGLHVSALSTITDRSQGKAYDIYSFFNKKDMDFSVNRCFSSSSLQSLNASLKQSEYKDFLSELYDIYQQKASTDVHIPCFDRCFHDLKDMNGGYFYAPRYSPYISVYNVESHITKFVVSGKIYSFDKQNAYRAAALNAVCSNTYTDNVQYQGSQKKCVIEHLCRQQNEDFSVALVVNT